MNEPARQTHTASVLHYLHNMYQEDRRSRACRCASAAEHTTWQQEARSALRQLIGLPSIAAVQGDHRPTVELYDVQEEHGFSRQQGVLHSEPGMDVPFWLLRPHQAGPYPLGLFPHGHQDWGMNTYAGVFTTDEARTRALAEDRDVAVQAARRGYLAIAPATRGFAPAAVPDLNERHGGRHCRSQLIHCLLAGRTAIGERVWDLSNLLAWGLALPEVDARRVLMMGNSGGGMATLYTAACEPRIGVAVPSCSFCTLVGLNGLVHHCDCNAVPGVLTFGEFHDIAGLIAPRHLLTVNGRQDPLFPLSEVERAVSGLRRIYATADAAGRYEHRWGDYGHRFYADLMWPFIDAAMTQRAG